MSLELLSVSQMAQADAGAVQAGVPSFALMLAAGKAVADEVMRAWSPRPVAVLCGPGQNGGDGLVAATVLHRCGWSVRVFTFADPALWQGDAQRAAQEWLSLAGSPERAWQPMTPDCLDGAALVIDALFGAGLSRPLDGLCLAVLGDARKRRLLVVAVDVPSGVWGDTGQSLGAVQADVTVTFFRRKAAHLLMPGKALCGRLRVRDIGVPASVLPSLGVMTWANDPALWISHWPSVDGAGHKYQRGHAVVWGGARMTGAARLSATAAARVGAGLTTVCVPPASWAVYATALTCVMVHALPDHTESTWPMALRELLSDRRLNALLIGPGAQAGMQPETLRSLALTMLASGRSVVLDADALSAFQSDPDVLFSAIAAHDRAVVLTPHEGEFARLFGDLDAGHSHDKLARARAAALRSGAVIVLKGADTVIASPDGRAAVNHGAPASLATAGTGDVLAGCIVGLLAQGMPAWQAACAACWLHGAAARAFGGAGLVADDLPGLLPQALRALPLVASAAD